MRYTDVAWRSGEVHLSSMGECPLPGMTVNHVDYWQQVDSLEELAFPT